MLHQVAPPKRSLIVMAVTKQGPQRDEGTVEETLGKLGARAEASDRRASDVSRGYGLPTVDLRVVLFTVIDGQLLVALEDADEGWRLPRGVPAPIEPLDAAARRIIRHTTDLHEQYLEQLYTFSVGEPPAWTVVVGYIALICAAQRPLAVSGADWIDSATLPPLSDTDRVVIDYALVRLRAKIGYTNIAFHLLPETFSLSELQGAYETILGRRLDKRNFRRRVIASGILEATDAKRREGSHRPAALYRFRAEHDPATYLTPPRTDGG
jgi:8-oxo-dGTP diphosphatase